MDLPTAIQVVTGLISVPSSIYAIVLIHRESQATKRLIEDAATARKVYVHLISSLSDRSDRVLLTFNKDNKDRPGTFEHLVWSYWREFEELTGDTIVSSILPVNNFIYNPVGVLLATESSVSYYKQNKLVLFVMIPLMISFFAPMMITSGIGELVGQGTLLHIALSVPFFSILIPLGIVLCWRSMRKSRQSLQKSIKALAIIRRYVALLEEMGIIVQQEFSQMKSKVFDSEQTNSITAIGKAGS
jgi:hypothetical protein